MEALKNWAEIRFTQNSYDMLYLQDVFSLKMVQLIIKFVSKSFQQGQKFFFLSFNIRLNRSRKNFLVLGPQILLTLQETVTACNDFRFTKKI